MKEPKQNLTGQKFGKLTATDKWERRCSSNVFWHCTCECGGTRWVLVYKLLDGRATSRGCERREGARTRAVPNGTETENLFQEPNSDAPEADLEPDDIPLDEMEFGRYELVYRPRSGWYGYFDREHEIEVLVSQDKEETLERIYELQRYPDDSHCRWGEFRLEAA